ncbi:sugar transferase [Candidatus Saccharibacteria bacterium]|nr:sugar transferase [Candidatus Saccharibacteria bacterium]MBH2007614.1 sugar transferase [Candidatus Saccharibacteria bacterium]
MLGRNSQYYSLFLLLVDAFVLILALTLAYVLRVQYDNRPLVADVYAFEYLGGLLVILPFWIGTFALLGLYSPSVYNRRLAEWGRVAAGSFVGILLILGWEFVSGETLLPARLVALYALVGSFLLIVLEREFLRALRTTLFRYGVGTSRVLLIGSGSALTDLAVNLADTKHSGYEIVAIAGPKRLVPDTLNVLHYPQVESALKFIDSNKITTIIQTDLYEQEERNQQILSAAQTRHISYNFIPGEPEFYTGKNTVDVFLGYPMISVSQTPLIGWGAIAKVIFDRVVSIILVILLSPVFLLLFITQKIFNPGPIFYVSKRLSQFSKPVALIKFRSMSSKYGKKDAAEEFRDMGREDLALEYEKNRKVANDPRITRFGNFLRRTSLDELPQLFNVVRGDLSLVGPRPILPQEAKFSRSRTALLHSVKSGVTGLWQVSGRSNLNFEERIELELFYAQNWSFWLDIKILFKTVSVVLFGRGAK